MRIPPPHRHILCLLLATIASSSLAIADSALLSTPKVAPRNHQPDVMVGKTLRGRFVGSNIYLGRPSPRQTLERSLAPTVSSLFKVQNDTPRTIAPTFSIFAVRSNSTSSRTAVTYLDSKRRNVTAQLARGRYLLNIAASADQLIYQKINGASPTSAGGSFGIKAEHRGTRLTDAANVTLTQP